MSLFQENDKIGDVVARYPALSRVFGQMEIDYCCGGKKTLGEICRAKGLDPKALLSKLDEAVSVKDELLVDAAAMSLTELADHIEQVHHAFLYSEFPRLEEMVNRLIAAHGHKKSYLLQIREALQELANELNSHMEKEEQILFPMVRQIDASETAPKFHCGSLANPINQMESEHEQAGSELESLRELTEGYTMPDWGCNTYRALMDAMVHLEHDLHQHIHKENNILFPRALKMEKEKAA